MDYKGILGAGVGIQSTALMASNLSLLNKKKKKKTDLVKVGVQNIVGTGLLNAQASMI